MPQTWNKISAFFRHPLFKRWLKRLAIFLLVVFVLAMAAWFALRGKLLEYGWEKAVNKLEAKGYTLACEEKSFTGIFEITFNNISLKWKSDALFSSTTLTMDIALWKSIFDGPSLSALGMETTRINLVKTPEYCNFCALTMAEKKENTRSAKPFLQRIFDLLNSSVSRIPSTLTLRDFQSNYRDSSDTFSIQIPALTYKNEDLNGTFNFVESRIKSGFTVTGSLDRSSLTGDLHLKPSGKKWAKLPILERKFHVAAGFESADFKLEELDMDDGVLHLIADGHFSGIMLKDRRLSDTNIIIRDCSGKLVANFAKDFIEIDSSTSLTLNKIKTYLYASANLGKEKSYTLKFRANKIKANDFFASLPQGMFRNLVGLQATGELEYRMFLHLEDKDPQNAIFDSELKPYNFKITKMGATNLAKMNGAFTHTFYERGVPVRSFVVGPSNGTFTPLESIPELLQKAVMTGEDPMFFGHKGFYQEAFRQSIVQNYVQGRFARGGSTISMQLVKNVFLSRKKTLARKAEEILIVWLIENQRLTSKARMFEVYLNIIEWGPGVFGIGEAAPFYFGKSPSELAPLECAFLASIVPMPKAYAYFIDSAGYVSDRDWNFVAIRNNMIKNGSLDAADSASFNVKITGPAANYLRNREESSYEDIDNEEMMDEEVPEVHEPSKAKKFLQKIFGTKKKSDPRKN